MKALYSEKLADVSSAMDECWQEDQRHKGSLNTIWRRNVDFANGAQQMSYGGMSATINNSQLFFTNGRQKRKQLYTTNEIEPIVRTLVSYMTRAKPAVTCVSPDRTDEGKHRARIGERVLDAKYEIDKEYANSRMSAYWALSIGTVFRKDYWDMSRGRDASIPKFDELGNEVIDPNTGEVEMDNFKTGDSAVSILTPMTVAFDWTTIDFDEMPWIEEAYYMPTEWARKVFDQQSEGYTGKAKNIQDSGGINYASISTLEAMKFATPNSVGSGYQANKKDKSLIRELYVRPSDDAPRGRLIIKAGSEIVYAGDSPYFMPVQKIMWHPYTQYTFEPYIGRFLGKSLVEQLVSLQMRLNEINGSILENANTCGKVGILAAENQLRRGVMSGEINITTYKPVPGASEPKKWDGVPLPQQFFKEKQDLIDAMVRIAGTNFVMQGQTPTGVTAAAAISQLLENASSQQSDTMIAFAKFHEQAFTKKLRNIRNFHNLPNDELVDYIRSISKNSLDFEIHDFIGEDLGDGLNVNIEEGSNIPKSQANKREAVRQLLESPQLTPEIGEDSPRGVEARNYIFKQLDLDPLETEQSKDIEKAKWENERMKRGMTPDPWEFDNHAIHKACHMSDYKTPEFIERSSPEVKQAFLDHLKFHDDMIQQEMMEQQQQAMMAQGMPPQMEAPPPPEMQAQAV